MIGWQTWERLGTGLPGPCLENSEGWGGGDFPFPRPNGYPGTGNSGSGGNQLSVNVDTFYNYSMALKVFQPPLLFQFGKLSLLDVKRKLRCWRVTWHFNFKHEGEGWNWAEATEFCAIAGCSTHPAWVYGPLCCLQYTLGRMSTFRSPRSRKTT